jgi:hypothetical protein
VANKQQTFISHSSADWEVLDQILLLKKKIRALKSLFPASWNYLWGTSKHPHMKRLAWREEGKGDLQHLNTQVNSNIEVTWSWTTRQLTSYLHYWALGQAQSDPCCPFSQDTANWTTETVSSVRQGWQNFMSSFHSSLFTKLLSGSKIITFINFPDKSINCVCIERGHESLSGLYFFKDCEIHQVTQLFSDT